MTSPEYARASLEPKSSSPVVFLQKLAMAPVPASFSPGKKRNQIPDVAGTIGVVEILLGTAPKVFKVGERRLDEISTRLTRPMEDLEMMGLFQSVPVYPQIEPTCCGFDSIRSSRQPHHHGLVHGPRAVWPSYLNARLEPPHTLDGPVGDNRAERSIINGRLVPHI